MPLTTFLADTSPRRAYLAIPPGGKGKGVLLLHAWWGLNDFFQSTCDRLASHGYVAFAPDLNMGKVANTIEEANHLLQTRDFAAQRTIAEWSLKYLQAHRAVRGVKVSAIGFSMGAGFTLLLDELHPGAFDKCVLFYGESGIDLSQSSSEFVCHFGEEDDWEPIENVRKMESPNASIYTYPGAGHWFFESDRPDAYNESAAALAWTRSLEFISPYP